MTIALSLGTSIAYNPRRKAEAPSDLRRAAYDEDGQLAPPDADPKGWKIFDPITISGTLFDNRVVNMECTVSSYIVTLLCTSVYSNMPLA